MKEYLITENAFIVKLEEDELFINLKKMRLACPCAHCKGEKDIFGNIYKGKTQTLQKNAFKIYTIRTVGNYAVRVFWKDKHANGIYTFDFLRTLSE